MLDRLIDVIIEFIELFQIFVFIGEYEEGVILRQGKFHRTVKPGLRWILPLAQEDVITCNVKPTPLYLDLQSLHTKEDYICNIQVGVIVRITDARLYLVENENTDDMLGLICSGVVTNSVQGCKWTEIRDPGYPKTLKAAMNRRVRKRGAEIDEIYVQDLAAGSANRLWHEGINLDLGDN